jgi:hypothetical protein
MPDIKDLETFYKAAKKRYSNFIQDLIQILNLRKNLKKTLLNFNLEMLLVEKLGK